MDAVKDATRLYEVEPRAPRRAAGLSHRRLQLSLTKKVLALPHQDPGHSMCWMAASDLPARPRRASATGQDTRCVPAALTRDQRRRPLDDPLVLQGIGGTTSWA
jgi:hypothetical protein